MASKQKLDLREVEWPISILKCNARIDGLKPGEGLDVFVARMDVVENLSLILAKQGDIRFEMVKKNDYYELLIQKKGNRSKKKSVKGQISSSIRPPTVKGDI